MPSPTDTPTAPAELDVTKMTKEQKLAVLLIMLGTESAAKILKGLEETEMQKVTAEMTTMSAVTQDVQWEILHEFSDVAVQASTALRGGVGFVKAALEKAVGTPRTAAILERVAPGRTASTFMDQFIDKDPHEIANVLRKEPLPVAALAVSYLPSAKAMQVLSHFKPEQCERILERLATLAPTTAEVVEKLSQTLLAKMGDTTVQNYSHSGGVKSTAALLNAMGREQSRTLLVALEKRNSELGQAIRQKMFTFEDLIKLDAAALQQIMREVDPRTLAMALKGAGDALKAKLLGCISKRAAEGVNEEISLLGRVKLRDIEAAQMTIIEIVRRLEESGDIELHSEE
jgi:flagellar motor switch protein FliG